MAWEDRSPESAAVRARLDQGLAALTEALDLLANDARRVLSHGRDTTYVWAWLADQLRPYGLDLTRNLLAAAVLRLALPPSTITGEED